MPGRRKKHNKNFRDFAKTGCSRFTVIAEDPSLNHDEDGEEANDPSRQKEKRLDDQAKYGIFFEDEYDYMQHLKDVTEFTNCEMNEMPRTDKVEILDEGEDSVSQSHPLSFGVRVEGDAMLAMAAAQAEPQPDWDQDIVAALDDEFNFEDPSNQLEDDFMALANPGENVEDMEDEEENLMHNLQQKVRFEGEDDGDFDCEEDDAQSDAAECSDEWSTEEEEEAERKPSHTKLSSAALPRNKNLKLLDAQTEMVMKTQYSEDQIGALDCEELDGRLTFDSDLFQQAVDQLKQSEVVTTMKEVLDSADRVRPVIPESWKYVEVRGSDEEDKYGEKTHKRAWSPKRPQWDSESIISTHSRTKNLPKTFEWSPSSSTTAETKKKRHVSESEDSVTEMSVESMRGLSLKELEQQNRTERLADAPPSYRPRGESAEEKRTRKQEVKQHKRERRVEKKANKIAFKTEMQRQTKRIQNEEAQEKVVAC